MSIHHLVLVMGILLSCVGGYFSVIGLATIFSGSYWSVIVMATALELSKVVAASWIYRSWSIAPVLIRTYMVLSVVVLVAITSMGIFGYLSKAHLEQTIDIGGNNEIQIEAIQRRIDVQERIIRDAENVVKQLDDSVEILQQAQRIRGPSGAIAVREAQRQERERLDNTIMDAYSEIESLQTDLAPLQKKQLSLEAEIGPLKYIAELIYGQESASDNFDIAVRWVIFVLVAVFDPLAIVLILAGNIGLTQRKQLTSEIKVLTKEDIMKDVDSHLPKSKEGHGLI